MLELTSIQRMHQEDHNRRHPGKICASCPIEVSNRARMVALNERYRANRRRETGIEFAFLLFAMAVAFLLFALFA